MSWDISFHAYGENFRPSQVGFSFTKAHDPGVIAEKGRFKGKLYPFGVATFSVPSNVPTEEKITYLVNQALVLLPKIKAAGATEWFIDIARYFAKQCNESLSREEIELIAKLECDLHYSAYQTGEEENFDD